MVEKYEPQITPWEIKESDYPAGAKPEEKLKFLLRYAILAPSKETTGRGLILGQRDRKGGTMSKGQEEEK